MKILKLTLEEKWFKLILSGKKKIEYREVKPWCTSRLVDKKTGKYREYDFVEFTWAYGKDRPQVIVEFKSTRKYLFRSAMGANGEELTYHNGYYMIYLGEIKETRNINKDQ